MASSLKAPRDDLRRAFLAHLADGARSVLRGSLPGTLLVCAISVLTFVLVDLVKGRVLLMARYRVDPATVELGELPAFVPDGVAEEIRGAAAIPARSILDPALDRDLRAAFGGHPWVKDVRTVRRMFPSRVVLEMELRVPAAVVDVELWRVTVDEAGRVLEDQASRAPPGLVVIRGDRRSVPRIPHVGGAFKSPAVLQGLSVLCEIAALREHPVFRHLRIAAIDVSRVGAKRGCEIELELANGTAVEWGSAPDSHFGLLEVPPAKKLDGLLLVHDRNPGYHGVARINVSVDSPVVTPAQ